MWSARKYKSLSQCWIFFWPTGFLPHLSIMDESVPLIKGSHSQETGEESKAAQGEETKV
jgi:hypothetical protein